ncbi:MAG TPA: DICT sensory domain-containing protein [Pyrinomonadaceae bacterium]
MKEFSMFEYALAVAGDATAELGDVTHVSRRDFCERDTFRFRARVPSMEYASLLIENELLLRTKRDGRIYAFFQRLSRMEPVVARYMRIADLSERVYVFGEPDWTPPRHPNMKVIELARGCALTREWIVIADSPTMHVALVGLDEEGFDVEDLEARYFSAFKTSDPAHVKHLVTAADKLIS